MAVATRKSLEAATAKSTPGVGSTPLPHTIQWHRNNDRGTGRDEAIKQQLLTPREEQAIVDGGSHVALVKLSCLRDP
jgi:hypothetical protein